MKLYNIVKVYTSTVGTGTVTLGSAVPSFITFATAGVITGSTVSYAIEDGNNREVGTGVYTSGAETLTRTVVTSTNSNNAITLSGNAVVFITGLAADLSSDTAATANTLVIRNGSGNFALGTPTSGTLTNCTGLPVSTGISGLGANVATFLTTPSSANLASVVTDETGTGSLVFGTSPTIATPTITTSATVPLVIGGTGTTSTLTLRSTSGVGTTGADIIFQTGNNGATEVMRLQNGGNVGIGTTPSYRLHVSGGRSVFVANSEPYAVGVGYSSGSAYWIGSNSANNALVFSEGGGSEKMRIDSSGNVLIGATSPAGFLTGLQVSKGATESVAESGSLLVTGPTTAHRLAIGYSNTYNAGWIQSVLTGVAGTALLLNPLGGNVGIGTSSPAYQTQVSGSGQTTAALTDSGNKGGSVLIADTGISAGNGGALLFAAQVTNGAVPGCAIKSLLVDGNTNGQSDLAFSTRNAVGDTSLTERMRINASGNIGIGTGSTIRSILNTHVGTITGPAVTAGLTLTAFYSGVTAVNSIDWNYSGQTSSPVRLGATFNSDGSGMEMVFYTSTSFTTNGSERVRINKDGNVGIGTASPLTKLQVGAVAGLGGTDGNVTLSAGTNMVYQVATSGAALTWNANTNGGNANTVMARLQPRQDTSANYNLDVFCGTWNNNNDPGTAVATFQSTGNVGIGTASPKQKLHVSGQGLFTSSAAVYDPGDSAGPAIRIGYSSSDYGYVIANETGVIYKRLLLGGSQIEFLIHGPEKVRIDSSGNVKIGGTADRATTAGTAHLDIFNGTAPVGTLSNGISIYSSSGEAYVMDAAGNATLFSPHDRETNEWIFDSTDTRTGKRLKINVERLLRFINDHFGLDCVHDLMEEA